MEALDRVTELSILYEISALPTRVRDLDRIGALAVDKAARLLGNDVAIFYLYRPETDSLHPQAARGVRLTRLAEMPMDSVDPAIAQAIARKRPLSWRRGESAAMPDLLGAPYTVRAAVCAPVRLEDKLLGLIYAVRLKARPFTASELSLFSVLADRVANAVDNADSFQKLQRRVSELQTLNQIGQALSGSLDVDELLATLHRQVNHVLDARNFYIRLYESDLDEWINVYHVERGERLPATRQPGHLGLTGYVIRTRQPLLLRTQGEITIFLRGQGVELVGEQAQSWLGVPLIAGDKVVGVMVIQSYEQENLYGEEEVFLLSTIAAQAAIAIDNARLVTAGQRRALQLQTAAEVAQAVSAILDLDELLPQVVDLIRERFGLYYVGLFLVDEARRWAILCAGTGEAGRTMLEAGHKLEVGGESMIGWCVAHGAARIAFDVGQEAVRFDNPLLPETRSEMALPLIGRGRAIGAMTIQSAQPAAFTQENITVLQTMADQVAVAIDNARLFAEAQGALDEVEAIQRRYLGQAWAEFMHGRAVSGYAQTVAGMTSLREALLPEVRQAMTELRPVVESGAGNTGQMEESSSSTLVVPLVLRSQPIGALGLKEVAGKRQWSDDELALAEAIAEQLVLAADNLRLLDETQRRAARERLVGEVTGRMRASLDMETVLATAVREISEALGLAALDVQLGTEVKLGDISSEDPTAP